MAEAPELSELEDSGLEEDEADAMEIDAKPAGPTWTQVLMKWRTPKSTATCKARTEWDDSGSEMREAVEHLVVVEERNADWSLTGFITCMARAKTPMPVEEWQWLFRSRSVTGIEDARDLGAEADRYDAAGNRVDERGSRARMLEDGRWIGETEEEKTRRKDAVWQRRNRINNAGVEAFNAKKAKAGRDLNAPGVDFETELAESRAARAESERAETERFRIEQEARKLGSAALAARATLAVRAAWGGKC
jgi:hypothetical protein